MATEVVFDDSGWQKVIANLKHRARQPAAYLKRLADTIGFADIIDHFEQEEGPQGKWVPWSPLYAMQRNKQGRSGARRRRQIAAGIPPTGGKILQMTGHLRQSLLPGRAHSQIVSSNAVRLFSNVAYSGAHQYGNPLKHLPARPFMWISSGAKDAITKALTKIITEGL